MRTSLSRMGLLFGFLAFLSGCGGASREGAPGTGASSAKTPASCLGRARAGWTPTGQVNARSLARITVTMGSCNASEADVSAVEGL